MLNETTDILPWYRQFWPWFLILLPASVVVAGFVTLYIAADGADVVYHDPFVPDLAEDGTPLSSVALTDQALTEADAVVIVTDHTDVDYARVLERAAVVVDARHVTAPLLDESRSGKSAWIVKGGPE